MEFHIKFCQNVFPVSWDKLNMYAFGTRTLSFSLLIMFNCFCECGCCLFVLHFSPSPLSHVCLWMLWNVVQWINVGFFHLFVVLTEAGKCFGLLARPGLCTLMMGERSEGYLPKFRSEHVTSQSQESVATMTHSQPQHCKNGFSMVMWRKYYQAYVHIPQRLVEV